MEVGAQHRTFDIDGLGVVRAILGFEETYLLQCSDVIEGGFGNLLNSYLKGRESAPWTLYVRWGGHLTRCIPVWFLRGSEGVAYIVRLVSDLSIPLGSEGDHLICLSSEFVITCRIVFYLGE